MKVLDLFSGIGGFSLAAHWAGMTTAAFCEIDPFCQKVLNKNFPGVPVYEDVRTITRQQLEKDGVMSDSDPIGLICGGIPCQPFSVSGKQLGTEDERHLWPEMYRLVKEIRPTWVLVENVTGFIKLALDLIINDLENEDYQTGTFVIPAAAVGAPHKRERIFIVGYTKRSGCGRESWRRTGKVTKNRHLQLEKENVANTNSSGQQELNVATITKRERFNTRGVDQIESEGINQPRLGGMLDGLPDWMDGYRLKTEEQEDVSTEINTRKILSPMWKEARKKEISQKQSLGTSEHIQEKNVLRQDMPRIGIKINKPIEINDISGISKICEGKLRNVPDNISTSSSSLGWEQSEQRNKELDDIVCFLSYEMACDEWRRTVEKTIGMQNLREAFQSIGIMQQTLPEIQKAWRSLEGNKKAWVVAICLGLEVWPNNMGLPQFKFEPPRVAPDVKNRKERLRALGNTVVPQVVYPILKAIMETE